MMERIECIVTLEKMIAGIKKGMREKPAWYAGASEEEKERFDTWSREKYEALSFAAKALQNEERLANLSKRAYEIGDTIAALLESEKE